jgi:phosphopantothenoylcysteine decarboxylase
VEDEAAGGGGASAAIAARLRGGTALPAPPPPRAPPAARRPRVILGISGSVAAVKWQALALLLFERGADVAIVATAAGARFMALSEG